MEHTELSRMGGLARAKKLSKSKRKAIAKKGGLAGGRGRSKKKKAA
jgi:hypothetical protein